LFRNCEIAYSVRLWTYWLVRFHSEVILGESTLEDQQMFFELLGILTEVVFYALENYVEIDPSVLLANANFFLTLVTSVRTQFIFQTTSVQTLIRKIHLLKDTVNPEVCKSLHAIFFCLVNFIKMFFALAGFSNSKQDRCKLVFFSLLIFQKNKLET